MLRFLSHWHTGCGRVVCHRVLWLTAALCNHNNWFCQRATSQSFIKIALAQDMKSCGRNAFSSLSWERTRPPVTAIVYFSLMARQCFGRGFFWCRYLYRIIWRTFHCIVTVSVWICARILRSVTSLIGPMLLIIQRILALQTRFNGQ